MNRLSANIKEVRNRKGRVTTDFGKIFIKNVGAVEFDGEKVMRAAQQAI
jgi:hypothetical protein